jgi:hypothetical protein
MNKLRDERGTVMVTAILMIMIMFSLGLAVLSTTDTQSAQSRQERERESSFNLAEAALSAQTFILGRRGTGTATRPYPADGCPTAGSDVYFCPLQSQLLKNYSGAGQVDFDAATTWRTYVLDDSDPNGNPVQFWKDDYLNVANWPRYDKAGAADGKANRHVWVRSQATVRGRTRAIVAWVRIEDRAITFPRYSILAGYIDGKNEGGHGGRPLVDSGSSLGVAVRCNQPPESSCIDLDPTKGPQLQPPSRYVLNYPSASAIDAEALQALEDVARANGTYYDTCPRNPNGDVVVVENAGDCRYTNSAPAAPGARICCNTQQSPGLYIVKRGKVDFGGNIEFWGVVYNVNLDNRTDPDMIETSGTAAIRGGALVDGGGGVYAGSAGGNIVYDAYAFDNITAVGTAGVVQNTWREIVPPTG